jgi:hypothetical protein
MKEYLRRRRLDADRDRAQRRRNRKHHNGSAPTIGRISERGRILAAVLGDEWTESYQLIERARRYWRNSAGRCLKDDAARQAFHRLINELCEIDIAETRFETHNGLRIMLARWRPTAPFRREDFARLIDEQTRFCHRDTVTRDKSASAQRSYSDKPGISEAELLEKNTRPLILLTAYQRTTTAC